MLDDNTYLKTTGRDGMPLMGVGTALIKNSDWHTDVSGDLKVNENGYHACRTMKDVLTWIGPELWLIEGGGDRLENGDAIVLRNMRAIVRVLGEEDWRTFAIARARQEFGIITSQYLIETVHAQLLDLIVQAQDYSDLALDARELRLAHKEATGILLDFKNSFHQVGKQIPEDLEILLMSVIHCLAPEPWCVMGWLLTKQNSQDIIVLDALVRHLEALAYLVSQKIPEGISHGEV